MKTRTASTRNKYAAFQAFRPADRVTDNTHQFRKRWRRVREATNFEEAAQ